MTLYESVLSFDRKSCFGEACNGLVLDEEPQTLTIRFADSTVMKGGSKYQPLLEYLRRSDRHEVPLTFTQIETIIGEALPDSARAKKAWWSNRTKGALQASAWMGAGFLVEEVNLASEQVTFRKPPAVYDVQRMRGTVLWNGELIKALRRHMGLSQAGFAEELGVRQQTVSDWETGMYDPRLATSKYLTMVAEKAAFKYAIASKTDAKKSNSLSNS